MNTTILSVATVCTNSQPELSSPSNLFTSLSVITLNLYITSSKSARRPRTVTCRFSNQRLHQVSPDSLSKSSKHPTLLDITNPSTLRVNAAPMDTRYTCTYGGARPAPKALLFRQIKGSHLSSDFRPPTPAFDYYADMSSSFLPIR